VRHVTYVVGTRSAYEILMGKFKGRKHLGDLGIDRKIMLKLLLQS
jgi:hypothetical protein